MTSDVPLKPHHVFFSLNIYIYNNQSSMFTRIHSHRYVNILKCLKVTQTSHMLDLLGNIMASVESLYTFKHIKKKIEPVCWEHGGTHSETGHIYRMSWLFWIYIYYFHNLVMSITLLLYGYMCEIQTGGGNLKERTHTGCYWGVGPPSGSSSCTEPWRWIISGALLDSWTTFCQKHIPSLDDGTGDSHQS